MNSAEAYLMPSHVRLLVSDVALTTAFYEALGFSLVNRDAVFVHLRWAKYADVFLVATPSGLQLPGPRGVGVLLCFYANGVPLETIASRASARGAVTDGPKEQPWFTREVTVTDPEGYRLTFVEPTEPIEA